MIKKQPSREAISSKGPRASEHHNNQSFKNTQNFQKPLLHESPSTKKLFQKGVCIPQFERPFHSRCGSNSNGGPPHMSDSFVKTEKTVQLHERLKNLHLFYKNKIQEEKHETSQRNNVFLAIIEEMQISHQEKMSSLKKMIEEAEGQKKDVGLVDDRMTDIKGSIDEILKQSSELKSSNEHLEREINSKQVTLREKQEDLSKLRDELVESRNELERFELLNLKENKRNKDIVSMIDKKEERY